MNKVIRDGKVAVLVSPGYGAGWSTWSLEKDKELMFDPQVVALVEDRDEERITTKQLVELVESYCLQKYGEHAIYCGGVEDLVIHWIPEGTQFKINEYDGSESIEYKENNHWVTA